MTAQEINAKDHYEQGVYLKQRGMTEKSRAALQEAIKLDKGEIGFKALSYLRSQLPAHPVPADAESMFVQAVEARDNKEYRDSETAFKMCMTFYPEFEWFYAGLGSQLVTLGHPKEALPYLEKAVLINPFYSNAYVQLSNAHTAMDNKDKALEYMRKAAASDPTDLAIEEDLKRLEHR